MPRQSLPKTSWVRVRTHLSGISGSDLHLLYGDSDMRIAPAAVPTHKYLYPGHEMVGEVIEIGDDVRRLRVGDRVALQNGPNCLSAGILPPCRFCIVGNYNLCENMTASPQPIGGGWSEEMLVHEQQLFQLPATLTDEQAVMLEPTSVALHAALRRLPKHGERVLIIGAGSIGLSLLQIIHTLAPQSEISVLARHAFQVERATRLGAAHIIYPRDAYVGVKRATQAKLYQGTLGNQTLSGGYDVIFDTVGRRKTLYNALRWTRAQGTIVLVGINLHMMNLDLTPIWYQEINLLGSTSHGMEHWPIDSGEQRSTFSAAIELIEQGRIAPEQLITHHFALNNYKHALLTTTNKAESRAIKVVFDYSLLPASVVPNVRASAPRRRPVTVNFDVDYPTREQEENDAQKQTVGEGSRYIPIAESTPDTPRPYTSTIQKTPPIRSFTKEMAHFSTRPNQSEYLHDDNEIEDTAAALPVVGKPRSGDSLRAYRSQPENHQSTPLAKTGSEDLHQAVPENHSPLEDTGAEHNKDISSHQTIQQDAEPADVPLDIPQQSPIKADFVPADAGETAHPGTMDANEDLAIESDEPAGATQDAEIELPAGTYVETEPYMEQQDEQAWESEQGSSEVAPAETIAAELDPQTLSPYEEEYPVQTQRSRPSYRKRKNNGR